MDYTTFFIRITMSFLFSLLIGLERQLRGRAIGLRTNVLVSIGSFLFVSFSFLTNSGDIARIAAQVVSGIGFLGAGVILKDGTNIRGLNTAATLWCAAAIGVLCAGGYLIEAAIGTFFILFSNVVLRFITLRAMKNREKSHVYEFSIICRNESVVALKQVINNFVRQKEINLMHMNTKEEEKNTSISVGIVINSNANYLADRLFSKLTTDSKVLSFSINRSESKRENNLDDDE